MTGWYQISDNRPGSAGCISCLTQLGTVLTAGQSPVSASGSCQVKVVTEHRGSRGCRHATLQQDHMFEDERGGGYTWTAEEVREKIKKKHCRPLLKHTTEHQSQTHFKFTPSYGCRKWKMKRAFPLATSLHNVSTPRPDGAAANKLTLHTRN